MKKKKRKKGEGCGEDSQRKGKKETFEEGREEVGMESECKRERGVSVFSHTVDKASEIDINFNREIPLRWAWGSATALGGHSGGECGWGDGRA